MKDKYFEACLSTAKKADISEGTILIEGKCHPYEITFHGSIDEDYKINIDDFGKTFKGKWIQMEPTRIQIQKMQNVLVKKSRSIYEKTEIENDDENYPRPDTLYNSTY
jgi:hypothetical protein